MRTFILFTLNHRLPEGQEARPATIGHDMAQSASKWQPGVSGVESIRPAWERKL